MIWVIGQTFAATTEKVLIDMHTVWSRFFAREWADIAELIRRQESREHMGHDNKNYILRGAWCECFDCRVVLAWENAHKADDAAYAKEMRKRK